METEQIPDSAMVTVVIATYNSGRYLADAICSVLNQTMEDWRLIVVDDGSTDNSLIAAEQLEDPRIRIVRHAENLGQTVALNTALGLVETPFFVQLDADDWLAEHALARMLNEAEKASDEVGLISANIQLLWHSPKREVIRTVNVKGRSYDDKYEFLCDNKSCWPRFYRTAAVKEVGGWPTDGPYEGRYIEDLRILLRLIPRYRFRWINETLYFHRRHRRNMTLQVRPMRKTWYWLIDKTLQEWGDNFRPICKESKAGYPRILGLMNKGVANTRIEEMASGGKQRWTVSALAKANKAVRSGSHGSKALHTRT